MDPKWFLLGFALAALAMGLGWGTGEDEPNGGEDPLARRPDPTAVALKRFWNKAFWKNPVSLIVVAVVTTPLGGFIAGPVLAGRAAEIWARRAGRTNSLRLRVGVGIAWFVVFLGGFFVLVWIVSS